MSSANDYYDVVKRGDKWVAKYDPDQQLDGLEFDSEEEAWAFVNGEAPTPKDTPQ